MFMAFVKRYKIWYKISVSEIVPDADFGIKISVGACYLVLLLKVIYGLVGP